VSVLPKVGAYAGRSLAFYDALARTATTRPILTIGSSDYVASIDATLPGGLEAGSYSFVIEGVSSEDYRTLFEKRATLVVDLHLYWRDSSFVSYLTDLAGLTDAVQGDEPPKDSRVAVLRVFAMKRRAGTRRYEVVIDARELVYDLALQAAKTEGKRVPGAALAIKKLCGALPVAIDASPSPPDQAADGSQPEDEWSWAVGQKALDRLGELGTALERQQQAYGLGMYLIRDGKLYFGTDRLTLVKNTDQRKLDDESGLIKIDGRGQEPDDPGFVPDDPTKKPPRRDLYELTLRGRPDVRPGDFVDFVRPPEERDEAGNALGFNLDVPLLSEPQPTTAYVRSVTHRMSRDVGFTTVLQCVSVKDEKDPWYRHASWAGRPSVAHAVQRDADGHEGFLAAFLARLAAPRTGIDVAQVRALNTDAQRPPQTEKIWRGLAGASGKRYDAVGRDFDKRPSELGYTPIASPFAWGKFGLVVPRYPGTRVVLAHRHDDPDDPIDVGALWRAKDGPSSKAGDWWLGLPAGVAEADRGEVADDQAPKDPPKKATNDLIDADGARVIEVGKLTVRVRGDVDHLPDAGTRPTVADQPLVIEHQSGARITIDQDGNVEIHAQKRLTLSADDGISITSKKDVSVTVGTTMDVSKGS
jgi:hypothetical protein